VCATTNLIFCFSSRRRHTRSKRDWSSDVCSSDLALFYAEKAKQPELTIPEHFVLGTVHRAENTDNPERLMGIFSALENVSETWRSEERRVGKECRYEWST